MKRLKGFYSILYMYFLYSIGYNYDDELEKYKVIRNSCKIFEN